jgi:hypothetical protein
VSLLHVWQRKKSVTLTQCVTVTSVKKIKKHLCVWQRKNICHNYTMCHCYWCDREKTVVTLAQFVTITNVTKKRLSFRHLDTRFLAKVTDKKTFVTMTQFVTAKSVTKIKKKRLSRWHLVFGKSRQTLLRGSGCWEKCFRFCRSGSIRMGSGADRGTGSFDPDTEPASRWRTICRRRRKTSTCPTGLSRSWKFCIFTAFKNVIAILIKNTCSLGSSVSRYWSN